LIAVVYGLTALGIVMSAFAAPPAVALVLGAQFEELGRLAPVFVLLAGLLALAEIIMRVAAVQGRTEIRVVYALVSWAAYLVALPLLAGRPNGVLWAFVVSCAASTYLPALLLKPIRWAGILNFAPIRLAALERPAS
jgi:O-antigen/teichoic acid export membrane protein